MTDSSPPEETSTSATFYATCTGCEFSREIDGQDAALQAADTHRQEHGDDHLVELYRLEAVERSDE